MADSRSARYQYAWQDATIAMPSPTSPTAGYAASSAFEHFDAFGDPFSLHNPEPATYFQDSNDATSYAPHTHENGLFDSVACSPSPFPSPFECSEQFDAATDSTASPSSEYTLSDYSPSPLPASRSLTTGQSTTAAVAEPNTDLVPAAHPYDASTVPPQSYRAPYVQTSPASPVNTLSSPSFLSPGVAKLLASSPFKQPPVRASIDDGFPREQQHVAGLTAEQRALQKRKRHREIDNRRRYKEGAALATLRDLVKQQNDSDGGSANEEEEAGEHTAEAEGAHRKVAVLDSSIAMIRQLQQLCAHMQAACNAKDQQIASLASDLQLVVNAHSDEQQSSLQAATRHVNRLQRASCLRLSGCLTSQLCVAVLAMPLSLILDCNDTFVECGGWRKDELVQSVLRPPAHTRSDDIRAARASHRVCPLMINGQQRQQKRRQLALSDGSAAAAAGVEDGEERYVGQYGSCSDEALQLIRGTKQKMNVLWRIRAATGELYEMQMTAWREELPPEQRDERQPLHTWRLITTYSMYDRVLIDEDDDSGTLMH